MFYAEYLIESNLLKFQLNPRFTLTVAALHAVIKVHPLGSITVTNLAFPLTFVETCPVDLFY